MDEHEADLKEGSVLPGRITRLEKYGAFVELFPGVEGLAHISEIADRRIRHPSDVLKIDEQVSARVLGINRAERRISLSLRQQGDAADAEPIDSEAASRATRAGLTGARSLGTLGDRLKAREKKPR